MKSTYLHISFFLISLLTLVSVGAKAQSYREESKFPPVKVFESMQGFSKKKQFDKLSDAMKYIEPLMKEIHDKYEFDVNNELREGIISMDGKAVDEVLQKLIYYDMKFLFEEIITIAIDNKQDKDMPKLLFRFAYADYLLLSPAVLAKENGFYADRDLKNLFRKAHRALGTSSPYQTTEEVVNIELFKKYALEIDYKLLTALPVIG